MSRNTPYDFTPTDPSSPSHYARAQTALLLCDFQNMTLGVTGSTGIATVPIATSLRTWASTHKILTIHSLISLSATSTPPPPTSRLSARWPGLASMVAANPSLGDEVDSLRPTSPSPTEVTDHRAAGLISALTSSAVRTALVERGVRSLIVAGLTSSGVVLSTARAAYDDGFVVTVVEDACADRTKETHTVVMRDVLITGHVAGAEVVMGELDKAWAEGEGLR